MKHDWNGFRTRLEEQGYLFNAEDALKIPRIAQENALRWAHIQRLLRLITKKRSELCIDGSLEWNSLLPMLLALFQEEDLDVLYEMDELLALLLTIDEAQGTFDFEEGSSSEYAKRVKQAFKLAKKEYVWRRGSKPEDFEPPFRIGKLPDIPRK